MHTKFHHYSSCLQPVPGTLSTASPQHVAVRFAFYLQVMKAVRAVGTVRVYGVLSGDTTTIHTIDMRAGEKALRGFILPQWIAKQVRSSSPVKKQPFEQDDFTSGGMHLNRPVCQAAAHFAARGDDTAPSFTCGAEHVQEM